MSAVAEHKPQEVAVENHPAPHNPVMDMIRQAIAANQPIEVIRELKDMAKELAADEARRAFDQAVSAAKADIPVIKKNRHVGFQHKNSEGSTDYWHEDFAEIARTVSPILSEHGLSYRFRTKQGDGRVTVTCILSHRDGHSEDTELSAAPDNSGKKNTIQQVGSAITYLQRYTLKLALGLAAAADDDGQASGANAETITEKQLENLRALASEVNADLEKFCQYFKIEALPELAAKDFNRAMDSLRAKKGRQQ